MPALIVMLMALAACGGGESETDGTQPDESRTESADPIVRGEHSFLTYCASCHGEDGRGAGPVAEVMTTQPADLTQLRAKYDGAFPADTVYAYIDGRADIQAHGPREMPVWGNIWSERAGEPVREEEVDLRSRELVEYIRTLQEEPAEAS